VRATILIAPPDLIPQLQHHPSVRDAQVFTDGETSQALDAISQHERPIVLVEQQFAASSLGQAFIRQVRLGPDGGLCEIQLVGVRRAARHKLHERVYLDGEAATLLDISTSGAHVLSSAPLKPRQRVRIALREGDRPLTGIAIWVHFELPREGPRYRAGVEFIESAAATLAEYISEITR
jgi:hypothetical protein